MNLCRLVLCLTVLASGSGLAQSSEEWNPYTPPAAETTTPPPLVPAPTTPGVPAPPAPPRARAEAEHTLFRPVVRSPPTSRTSLRLISSPWTGAIGGFVGLFAGIIPTSIVAVPFCARADFDDGRQCAIALSTALSLSYSVGVTLGVSFTGKLLGGQGDGLVTFFGALAGAAMGGGIGIASESAGALALGLSLGPLLFAIAGYELSHYMATQPFEPRLEARAGFRMMPVVGTTPRGGVLGGLAGRF